MTTCPKAGTTGSSRVLPPIPTSQGHTPDVDEVLEGDREEEGL